MRLSLNLISILILSSNVYAQIPAGYYSAANGQTGYTLKSTLNTIITNGHITRAYGDLYSGYQSTDNDIFYDNDNSVLDMYSEIPNGVDTYSYQHNNRTCGNYDSENDCYNREHLMPQSTFNSALPMRSDIHFVVPSDGYINGIRSNLPFGIVENYNFTSSNGSKRGNNISNINYTDDVFEPIDEFKGDIARCLLYVATRYEQDITGWTYTGVLDGSANQVYHDWFINLLVSWHLKDTVNQREIVRNNESYVFQGNRNPFIDHPEYVVEIWGEPDTINPLDPSNLVASNITNTSVDINWDQADDSSFIDKYHIYINNINGDTSLINSKTLQNLSPGTTYNFSVRACDSAGLISNKTNTIVVTTTGNSTASIEEEGSIPYFNIFPNPSSGIVNITVIKPSILTVYSINGILINTISVENYYTISLKKGVYIAHLSNDYTSKTTRLIIR